MRRGLLVVTLIIAGSRPSGGTDSSVNYSFKENAISAIPTGLFCSSSGQFVIAGGEDGSVYRSTNYGKSFSQHKSLKLSSGSHAVLAGLAMSLDGSKMVAGTATHPNFHSSNHGHSWTESTSSGNSCSLIAGNADLSSIVCIGGEVGKENYLYYGGVSSSLTKSTSAGKGKWIGVVGDASFTHLVAVQAADTSYIFISKDRGETWIVPPLGFDWNTGSWGALCSSQTAMSLMITDTDSLNAHISVDGGLSWIQGFNGANYGLDSSQGDQINTCAVSANGKLFALGFTGEYIQIASDCTEVTVNGKEECDGNWNSQTKLYMNNSSFDTQYIAFDASGKRFFAVDASKLVIATGS